MAKKAAPKQEEPIEKQMWKAAEYKHIVLGLIFLKYISDAFDALYEKLQQGEGDYAGVDPEDKDKYKAENVFFVPETARWSYLLTQAKQPDIGKTVDAAMDAIEKENPSLRDVLPKVFAQGITSPGRTDASIPSATSPLPVPRPAALTSSAMCLNIFSENLPLPKAKRAASSTLPAVWSNCWRKCWPMSWHKLKGRNGQAAQRIPCPRI